MTTIIAGIIYSSGGVVAAREDLAARDAERQLAKLARECAEGNKQ